MTYRERREARAERLRDWAESRDAKAAQAHDTAQAATAGIEFGQPILVGHHSERRHRNAIDRSWNAMGRAVESSKMADRHREKADEIDRQAKNAIYSDDPDAVERLEAKLATMEAARETMKVENREWLKGYRAELKEAGMTDTATAYERDQARPHPSYAITNLGGNISRTRKRLAALKANGGKPPVRTITARRDGDCARCDEAITAGDLISRIDGEWGHATCPGKEAT